MKHFTLLLTGLSISSVVEAFKPVIKTVNGSISGLYLEDYNQDAFLGIPYAQPPVGPLRFATPSPFNESWDGDKVRQFIEYGPACWNTDGQDTIDEEHAEDCLTLNIVKPHGQHEELPVAIWIHGGGFFDGSGSRPAYNLSFIVDKSVEIGKPFIGVSVNYRLNAFGFLNSRETSDKGWTNVGLRDQIKAIEWVHENIQAFGGNPEHIVLWGESAGAFSVGKLLLSDHLGSYIKGGILQSGGFFFPGLSSIGDGQGYYDSVVSYLNCDESVDTLKCLQQIDEKTLFHAFNSTDGVLQKGRLKPYADHDIVSSEAYEQLLSGGFYKVPILIGTNTDEGTFLVNHTANSTDYIHEALANRKLFQISNTSVQGLLDLYPIDDPSLATPLDPTYNNTPIVFPDTFGRYFSIGATLLGDLIFNAPARIASNFLVSHNVPVYKYRFNIQDKNVAEKYPFLGAAHFQEVVYVFNNNQSPPSDSLGATWNPDPRSANISSTISKLWVSFIADLDPNAASKELEVDNAKWPAYSEAHQNLVFDLNGFYLEDDNWRREQIQFIESIEYELNF